MSNPYGSSPLHASVSMDTLGKIFYACLVCFSLDTLGRQKVNKFNKNQLLTERVYGHVYGHGPEACPRVHPPPLGGIGHGHVLVRFGGIR